MNANGPIAGATAFALVLLLVPVVKRLCQRSRLFDLPGPLKIHSRPIPRLGGIAIALAISAATFFPAALRARSVWHFFAALGLIWAAGLADDLRGVAPVFRLVAQIAAGVTLWHGGWRLPAPDSGPLGVAAVCIFVVTFVNAFNFLDGSDGLAAGVAGIVAAGYLGLPDALGGTLAAAVDWSLVGACAGFLLFNFPPASIFLGDSGSTVLGYGIAFLALNLYRSSPATSPPLLFPVLVAGLPLLDAALAVIRRVRMRGSPFCGDRRHFYDLLLARGSSPRRVVLACYGITVTLVVIGRLGMRGSAAQFLLVSGLGLAALLVGALWLGALREENKRLQTPRVRLRRMEEKCEKF